MAKITYIPGEIVNAAIDENGNRKPVTRTQHIFDDFKGKSQADVNKEFSNAIGGLNSQNYVTVDSFNALPATGEADTVYRVSNWDGSQQDPSVYSEYAWDGSQYVHLSTKTQIGEVFDISAYHASGGTLATYADLSAALDSNNGGGVPQSLQRGGMSVKFVHTSDNKYVQYRLMADEWSANIKDWESIDKGLLDFTVGGGIDLAFSDKDVNCPLLIKDGNIITKKFNSKDTPSTRKTNYVYDAALQDENGNTVCLLKDGHIFTKNFDSSKLLPNNWKGKNVCIIGDSLTDQGYFTNYLQQELGCNLYNRGWSGAMVTPTSNFGDDTAYRFIGRFDLEENNNPTEHHLGMPSTDLIDLIIIEGGGNDWINGNNPEREIISIGNITDAAGTIVDGVIQRPVKGQCTFVTALKYLCYRAKLKYPNIPLALCTLPPSWTYTDNNNSDYIVAADMSVTQVAKTFADGDKTKEEINNLIRLVAKQFGAYVIDYDRNLGWPTFSQEMANLYTNNGDMIHPSHVFGASIIGKYTARFIEGNIPCVNKFSK